MPFTHNLYVSPLTKVLQVAFGGLAIDGAGIAITRLKRVSSPSLFCIWIFLVDCVWLRILLYMRIRKLHGFCSALTNPPPKPLP